MKFIERNWFVLLAFLMVLGGLIYLFFKNKSATTSTTVATGVPAATAVPAGAISAVSAAPIPTKSATIIGMSTGKPIVLMFAWPSDPTSEKSLLVQCRLADITEFSVGDYVTLPGSKYYPGRYKVWYDYTGNNPAVGAVRNLYLETKFITNETGDTIAKA